MEKEECKHDRINKLFGETCYTCQDCGEKLKEIPKWKK